MNPATAGVGAAAVGAVFTKFGAQFKAEDDAAEELRIAAQDKEILAEASALVQRNPDAGRLYNRTGEGEAYNRIHGALSVAGRAQYGLVMANAMAAADAGTITAGLASAPPDVIGRDFVEAKIADATRGMTEVNKQEYAAVVRKSLADPVSARATQRMEAVQAKATESFSQAVRATLANSSFDPTALVAMIGQFGTSVPGGNPFDSMDRAWKIADQLVAEMMGHEDPAVAARAMKYALVTDAAGLSLYQRMTPDAILKQKLKGQAATKTFESQEFKRMEAQAADVIAQAQAGKLSRTEINSHYTRLHKLGVSRGWAKSPEFMKLMFSLSGSHKAITKVASYIADTQRGGPTAAASPKVVNEAQMQMLKLGMNDDLMRSTEQNGYGSNLKTYVKKTLLGNDVDARDRVIAMVALSMSMKDKGQGTSLLTDIITDAGTRSLFQQLAILPKDEREGAYAFLKERLVNGESGAEALKEKLSNLPDPVKSADALLGVGATKDSKFLGKILEGLDPDKASWYEVWKKDVGGISAQGLTPEAIRHLKERLGTHAKLTANTIEDYDDFAENFAASISGELRLEPDGEGGVRVGLASGPRYIGVDGKRTEVPRQTFKQVMQFNKVFGTGVTLGRVNGLGQSPVLFDNRSTRISAGEDSTITEGMVEYMEAAGFTVKPTGVDNKFLVKAAAPQPGIAAGWINTGENYSYEDRKAFYAKGGITVNLDLNSVGLDNNKPFAPFVVISQGPEVESGTSPETTAALLRTATAFQALYLRLTNVDPGAATTRRQEDNIVDGKARGKTFVAHTEFLNIHDTTPVTVDGKQMTIVQYLFKHPKGMAEYAQLFKDNLSDASKFRLQVPHGDGSGGARNAEGQSERDLSSGILKMMSGASGPPEAKVRPVKGHPSLAMVYSQGQSGGVWTLKHLSAKLGEEPKLNKPGLVQAVSDAVNGSGGAAANPSDNAGLVKIIQEAGGKLAAKTLSDKQLEDRRKALTHTSKTQIGAPGLDPVKRRASSTGQLLQLTPNEQEIENRRAMEALGVTQADKAKAEKTEGQLAVVTEEQERRNAGGFRVTAANALDDPEVVAELERLAGEVVDATTDEGTSSISYKGAQRLTNAVLQQFRSDSKAPELTEDWMADDYESRGLMESNRDALQDKVNDGTYPPEVMGLPDMVDIDRLFDAADKLAAELGKQLSPSDMTEVASTLKKSHLFTAKYTPMTETVGGTSEQAKNKNPGNLSTAGGGGATFETVEDGWRRFIDVLDASFDAGVTLAGQEESTLTLREALERYASQSNNPTPERGFFARVARAAGVTLDSVIDSDDIERVKEATRKSIVQITQGPKDAAASEARYAGATAGLTGQPGPMTGDAVNAIGYGTNMDWPMAKDELESVGVKPGQPLNEDQAEQLLQARVTTIRSMISKWTDGALVSKSQFKALIEAFYTSTWIKSPAGTEAQRYGQPEAMTPKVLVAIHNGNWEVVANLVRRMTRIDTPGLSREQKRVLKEQKKEERKRQAAALLR
tara:strand:+ start:1004 stop:5524 length:4521 start_codon:yes stop_codon:yes gene_type:complete